MPGRPDQSLGEHGRDALPASKEPSPLADGVLYIVKVAESACLNGFVELSGRR
ncbi:hypothetical protein ACH4VM_38445 [Streptomyces sp. NPDC020792]|uniref:hypothetical protein n=1 Tax=Streptomyces sp. NPDC020792 TaxID=3365089 RepID=UPI0037BAEBDB